MGTPEWRAVRAAVAMLTLCTACTPSAHESSPKPDVTEEVRTFLEGYLAAIDSRDAERIRTAFVDDGRFVWIEDGSVRYRSAEEVLASLGEVAPDQPIRTVMTNLKIVPVGATAAHAWATFSTTVGRGPDSFSFGGTISFVAERIDESWKLIGGHSSSASGR